MKLNSLGALSAHLSRSVIAYRASLGHALDEIGSDVATEVQTEIGEYQGGIGPFPPMPPLADSTLDRKSSEGLGKGGNPDTPLYATGAFQNDVSHAVDLADLSVEVGTNRKEIAYTEFGTDNQPPRPIFGPATLRILPKLQARVAMHAAAGIAGMTVSSHGGQQSQII